MFELSRPLRLALYTLVIIAGAAIAATLAMRHTVRQSMVEDAARANQQLALYATSLHTLIERYRALPSVLALDPQLREALNGPVSAEQQDVLNRKLEKSTAPPSPRPWNCWTAPAWPWRPATGACPAVTSATTTVSALTSARPAPRAPGAFMRWA
jgi:hypothetical protein